MQDLDGNFARLSKIEELNRNFKLADSMPLQELARILSDSEIAYYNNVDDPTGILDDRVYDYAKAAYRSRRIKDAQLIVSEHVEGMSHVPKPQGRLIQLPIWMGSADKMNMGMGQVASFAMKFRGPYCVSAKYDGASALFTKQNGVYKLYSRGDGNEGQDLTVLLRYLNLPEIDEGVMIRGELIMQKSIFNAKYKKMNANDVGKYRNSRNAVSGLVNKIGSMAAGSKASGLNEEFVRDIKFIVYEVIIATQPGNRQLQLSAGDQFVYLEEKFGPDIVAEHEIVDQIYDSLLSGIYDDYAEGLDFEIDGIIVTDNHEYERPHGENPSYMKAFKKPLAILTSETKVINVEWNVSKDSYIKPTLIVEPIQLDGVTIGRCTAYNAKFIIDNKLGPGSIVEITRAGGVIPKVIKIVKESDNGQPQMPRLRYEFNSTNVDIILEGAEQREFIESDEESDGEDDMDEAMMNASRDVRVKQLHFFLTSIGTKGIGEAIMGRMYDSGILTIRQLLTVTPEQIAFLGPVQSEKVVKMIRERILHITMPVLMAGCGVFGRGMGQRRFDAIFAVYPNLLDMDVVVNLNIEEITALILTVPGFAFKTASQVANAMPLFSEFLEQIALLIPIQEIVVPQVNVNAVKNNDLMGKNVVLTGFRDNQIQDYLPTVGAKWQKAISGTTNILIIKDASYRNTKTAKAEESGIKIMTRKEFMDKYLK